jgi:hypothetical protein
MDIDNLAGFDVVHAWCGPEGYLIKTVQREQA